MGKLAGQKDAKILSGTKAGDLPIEDAPDYAIVFNLPHTFGGAVRVYDNFVRTHKTLRTTTGNGRQCNQASLGDW